MSIAPETLLFIYCLVVAAFAMVGGLIPQWIRLTHTHTQLVLSLVSGLMLGVAFFHLLPHAIVEIGEDPRIDGAIDGAMLGAIGGLTTMLLLLRLFHFHQHDPDGEGAAAHSYHHNEEPGSSAHAGTAHPLSGLGIGLGFGMHTLLDGVALGAVMQGSLAESTGILGISVFLAIALHKPLDAMSISTVMRAGGWGSTVRFWTNLSFALLCPLGALLFFYSVPLVGESSHLVVGCALAFSAGTFVCIALSDLLPEVQFHSHDRIKLTTLFVLGLALAYAIGLVEPETAHHIA